MPVRPRRPRHILGLTALLLGACACGLAAIPGVAFDEPSPWLSRRADDRNGEGHASRGDGGASTQPGGVSVSTRRFRFTLGRKPAAATTTQPTAPPSPAASPAPNSLRSKPYTIAAIVVSLAGLVCVALAAARERGRALPSFAAAFCVAAITWQYVMAGILIGMVIAVVILVLSAFS